MKIQETVERDCCDTIKDLKPYKGIGAEKDTKFCIHCGQIWTVIVGMDAAGGKDYNLKKIDISYTLKKIGDGTYQ